MSLQSQPCIPNPSHFARRLLKRKMPVKTIPRYLGLIKLNFQLRSRNLSLQLYCFHSWCGDSRQCVGSALRLRKIIPLCSRNVVFDAMSGFHFPKLTLDTTRSFVLRTCSCVCQSNQSRPIHPTIPTFHLQSPRVSSKFELDSALRRFYQ